jgi:hypothetical protein
MLPEMQRTAQSSPVPVPAFSELHQLVLAERIIGSQFSPCKVCFLVACEAWPPLACWLVNGHTAPSVTSLGPRDSLSKNSNHISHSLRSSSLPIIPSPNRQNTSPGGFRFFLASSPFFPTILGRPIQFLIRRSHPSATQIRVTCSQTCA